ncbi:sensor histidine kinase [Nocardioides alcanivorans]|uniref:sensor histidine kinase n=1 Tax=Nocardioides alcanivorans TaxID=2897352 RepID=UPI001F2AB0CF|nr:histidine kinase [Nocardioides alcanivorans]
MKTYLRWQVPARPWETARISRRASVARYVGCVLISGALWITVAEFQEDHPGVFVVDMLLGIVAFAVVHLRRRHPVPVAVLTAVIACFSAAAAGPATLAAVSVATRRNVPQILVIGLISLGSALGFASYMQVETTSYLLDLSVNIAFVAAMMAWGMYIGSRRELLHNLHDRLARAEAEQELRAAKAKGDERARIAREMHDVLAHRISQVSMLSGALSFRTDLTAEQMREHAGLIQTQSNAALDDLRAVLGVLRDRESGELLDRPQPTWGDLPDLIAEARLSGDQIFVDDRVVDPGSMAATTGRAAYRTVQEAITNARKHAPSATVHLLATGGPEEGLHLVVRNPIGFVRGVAPGAGLGLVGLTERAVLIGGTLEHGRNGDDFVVQVWLPWSP